MAIRKLRIQQPNKSDALVPNINQNIVSFTEIIKNSRQQMRVELVEVDDNGNVKVLQTIMESPQFESETKKANVIQNLADENAELKRMLSEMQAKPTNDEVEKPKGKPGRKPNLMKEEVEA